MTPTNQTPSECKHFGNGKCSIGPYLDNRRGILNAWCRGEHCPDYEPKEKSQLSNNL